MISLLLENKPKGLSKSFFNKLEKTLSKKLLKSGQIELIFLDIEEMKKINFDYRDKDYATDVLSFNLDSKGIVGQVFVCYDVASRQAKEHNWTIENEIALLVTHGVLHIYEYDHELKEDFDKMRNIENIILNLMELEVYEEKS